MFYQLLCAAAAFSLAMTLQGCSDEKCSEAKSESDCGKDNSKCFWGGCESRSCADSYGDSVETYCACTLEAGATMNESACKARETGDWTKNQPAMGDECSPAKEGCVCNKCSGVLAAGRLYTTEEGVLLAHIRSNQSSSSQSQCDWSQWPLVDPGQESTTDLQAVTASAKLPDVTVSTFYQNVGLAEHASVASFSRAVMELMEFGAPASLVDRTLAAAREEIAHAQMALALAKLWSAEPFELTGIDGLLESQQLASLAAFVKRTAIEACAGETPAVLRAVLAHHFAEDSMVREYYSKVIVEELRHAELAWATLGWALLSEEQDSRELQGRRQVARKAASKALASAIASLQARSTDEVTNSPGAQIDETRLLRAGILSKRFEAKVLRMAVPLLERLHSHLIRDNVFAGGLDAFESFVHEQFQDAVSNAKQVAVDSQIDRQLV